jgi:enoyl-CoA hydratase
MLRRPKTHEFATSFAHQVALLTLNRPDRLNALSNELLAAIVSALDNVELDPAVRAVVITGAGRAFSAGADIAAFQRHIEAGPAQAGIA